MGANLKRTNIRLSVNRVLHVEWARANTEAQVRSFVCACRDAFDAEFDGEPSPKLPSL